MRAYLELPRLSMSERDHRWTTVRNAMEADGLDCLVLFGWPNMWDFNTANARYLCPIGGNAAFNILIFPLRAAPVSLVYSSVMVNYFLGMQEWVTDIRARRGTWADSIADCLEELGLSKARIGIDGLAGPLDADGWLPHDVYTRMKARLAGAEIENIGEMIERIRTIKSAEEMTQLRKAADLGDRMIGVCQERARPGVRECQVYAAMREEMLAGGGEEPTLFLWASDRHPNPHPFHVPTMRELEVNDLIICEIHPKFGGYCTHIERTFSLGPVDSNYARIYEGCLEAYDAGMKLFQPGASISETMHAVGETIGKRALGICEAGIHGHGLGSLEYPRYRLHALESDKTALKSVGGQFTPGMVFAFNIDLVDPNWLEGSTGCVFAETIEITQTGSRRLHTAPLDLLICQGDH
jgi:Xaa-Pro dipeptidase